MLEQARLTPYISLIEIERFRRFTERCRQETKTKKRSISINKIYEVSLACCSMVR